MYDTRSYRSLLAVSGSLLAVGGCLPFFSALFHLLVNLSCNYYNLFMDFLSPLPMLNFLFLHSLMSALHLAIFESAVLAACSIVL